MTPPRRNLRDVFPPTGPDITAKSWSTEAPLRMLMNNLHPDVAENPHELVVYGGMGRAARTWNDFDRIVESLRALETTRPCSSSPASPSGSSARTRTPRGYSSPTRTSFRTGRTGRTSTSSIARA